MNERIEKIKTHLRENKKVYITGAVCLVVGVVVARRGDFISGTIEGNHNFVGKAEHVTMVVAELERRGHPGNILQCNETGEVFASQRRAAEVLGLNRFELIAHLKGEKPNVSGLSFTSLGEAA